MNKLLLFGLTSFALFASICYLVRPVSQMESLVAATVGLIVGTIVALKA